MSETTADCGGTTVHSIPAASARACRDGGGGFVHCLPNSRDRDRCTALFLPRAAGEGDHAKHGGGGIPAVRAPTRTVRTARRLRRALSAPEARLWSRLRERAPGRPVFRRQHPIGPYVLDFYCAKARLAVEIDGASHDMGDRP